MDCARHIRIYEPTPDHDFVSKRELAIKDLRTQFLKSQNVLELVELASCIVGSVF